MNEASQNGTPREVSDRGWQDSLADRLKAGNHEAAAELVDNYYEQIYLFMRRLGFERQTSEDLTQEIFMQVWQHIGQLRNGKALTTWLYRIAANVSKHRRRDSKTGKATISVDAVNLADDGPTSFDKVGLNELLERLNPAIAGLQWRLKQAVVLHYMQHLTIADAAEATGVRVGTFKSRLNRAITKLRSKVIIKDSEV
jgi:RNA polymerase sigma-70 factor (ECF subfamily)